ncbi:MAG: hypothetical protein IPN94_06100 [Sphingobacteriales bacterium]|nr:hypothetical protein [Sphingobacteriales bacterium]
MIWTCQNCGDRYGLTLYRSIWGEIPENRSIVMNDTINSTTCPNCGRSSKLLYPLLYTHKNPDFAVWWEPIYDKSIDEEKKIYGNLPGIPDYLINAPRYKDWEEFKSAILKFESETQKQPDINRLKEIDLHIKHIIQEKIDPIPKKKWMFRQFIAFNYTSRTNNNYFNNTLNSIIYE